MTSKQQIKQWKAEAEEFARKTREAIEAARHLGQDTTDLEEPLRDAEEAIADWNYLLGR